MLKKTILASLLAAASAAAFAIPAYYVVVPLPGKAPAAPIVVALNAATLPTGQVGQAYSYDLNTSLSVTGDADFTPAGVTWSITSGALPASITLTNGVLAGTPTVKNTTGNSFQVLASYKTKDGTQAYTIIVNGVALQVTSIAAGDNHTCAVTTAGAAKCWGDNSTGQLGDGSYTNQSLPVGVSTLSSGVARITAGGSHSCAVMTTGAAKCWGTNDYGQLGDGTYVGKGTPVAVSGMVASGAASISAGGTHTCAVTTAGGAKCWGWNGEGELGDNTYVKKTSPVNVSGLLSGVASISASLYHTCAVTTAGGAKCWGGNSSGELGDNTQVDKLTPVDVNGLSSGVASVSAGHYHTCAVTTAGAAKCWGNNGSGQLGDGTTVAKSTPTAVSGLGSGVSAVATGNSHSCAVVAGGVKCWGANGDGQLGDGTVSPLPYTSPVAITGLTNVTLVTAGYSHTCAAGTGGAKCWGYDNRGQLGNDTPKAAQTTPQDVQP